MRDYSIVEALAMLRTEIEKVSAESERFRIALTRIRRLARHTTSTAIHLGLILNEAEKALGERDG